MILVLLQCLLSGGTQKCAAIEICTAGDSNRVGGPAGPNLLLFCCITLDTTMTAIPSIPLRVFKNSWLSDSDSITTSPAPLNWKAPKLSSFLSQVCNSSLANLHSRPEKPGNIDCFPGELWYNNLKLQMLCLKACRFLPRLLSGSRNRWLQDHVSVWEEIVMAEPVQNFPYRPFMALTGRMWFVSWRRLRPGTPQR